MPTIVLDLLKYVFLAMLYIFVARAVRAIYQEMRPAKVPRVAPQARSKTRPVKRGRKAPGRVKVLEGEGLAGKIFELNGELLIGRAEKCNIVIQDVYASQVHARIFEENDSFMVEDMGSTNGTYLNRQRVSGATELFRGDKIKIGKTVLELRR